MNAPKVLGLAGWSGSGKTTLLTGVIPLLVKQGLKVATLKHAHHAFDVDTPGKDSYEHRRAGAHEVIVASARRWVQMHELTHEAEPDLAWLLTRVTAADLILVEGFKREAHPKLEIYRSAVGKPLLYPEDPRIVAIATDSALPAGHPARVDINDLDAVAALMQKLAQPLEQVLQQLQAQR